MTRACRAAALVILGGAAAAAIFLPRSEGPFARRFSLFSRWKGLFIVEGDLVLNETQLFNYLAYAERPSTLIDREGAQQVLGAGREGKGPEGYLAWTDHRELTYCVEANFSNPTHYSYVRAEVRAAADEWQASCPMRFVEVPGPKGQCAEGAQVFIVRSEVAPVRFFALSFYPDAPPENRILRIQDSYFGRIPYDRRGVLRHELGHILGLCHEHTRAPARLTCDEDPDASIWRPKPLTAYDPSSVMHYLCKDSDGRTVGNPRLEISSFDREAIRRLYPI